MNNSFRLLTGVFVSAAIIGASLGFCGSGNGETDKPKAMWIDTEANFELLASRANIDAQLTKIKEHGMNMVYVDAKAGNGYAMYRSDILPYCDTFGHKTVTRDYDDYLGYIIDKCDELGLDVVASVCAMGYGIHDGELTQGLIYDQPDRWLDKCQVRSVDGDTTSTVSAADDPQQAVVLLSPASPEVRRLLAGICAEIVTRYPGLKGINLDYLRYSNNTGGWYGLGDLDLKGYAAYWNEPVPRRTEIITADGSRGPKFARWNEFRASCVKEALQAVRDTVKAIRPDCEIHLWAGGDWISRYEVGQNWASDRYIPDGPQYTDTYNRTGFAGLLDVFVNGAYTEEVWIKDDFTRRWSVENMVMSCGDYLLGDCRSYGSIPAYAFDDSQNSDATYLCLKHTDGFMTFELSHVNHRDLWDSTTEGFNRYITEIKKINPIKTFVFNEKQS